MNPRSKEREGSSGLSQNERQSLIGREKATVKRELSLLSHLTAGRPGSHGILTTGDCRVVTSLYPQILDGMRQVYEKVEAPQVPEALEYFVNQYLFHQLESGRAVPDREVDKLRKDLKAGRYSQQLDLVRRLLREEQQPNNVVVDMNLFPDYASREDGLPLEQHLQGPISDAVIDMKRQVMTHDRAMREALNALYGGVDVRAALLTELVLGAPFLYDLISGKSLEEQILRRHRAYLQESIDFARSISIDRRIGNFGDTTREFPVDWVLTFPPMEITPFDKRYLAKIYEASKRMFGGEVNLDELHGILCETVLRRGRVFKTAINKEGYLELKPTEPESLSWGDIGGYADNTRFLRMVLEKIAAKDPLVGDLNIILLAGKPGTGKSLAATAFLNNLPENARGIFVDRQDTQRTYSGIVDLARLHPELEIFVVIEDIDQGAGDRNMSFFTGTLLEINSALPDALPANVHLIATTNRPEIIDPAVKRPGRTSEILVYDNPDEESRRGIVGIHCKLYGLGLDDNVVAMIGEMTDGFTPDEIRHIIWSIKFAGITRPTKEDIGRFVAKINLRRGAVDAKDNREQPRDLFSGFQLPS